MITLSSKAYLKLKHFVLNVDGEISGLGKSILTGDEVLVEDIEIFHQDASFGSTTLHEKALARFLDDLMQREEDPSEWNLWWHSHGGMETFWSATDTGTIDDFGGDYFISLVVNKRLEALGRLDIYKPFRFTVPLPIFKPRGRPMKGQREELEKYCKKRIKKCVKQRIGFFGKQTYLTPWRHKTQLPLSEEEILEVPPPTDWPNLD